MDEIDFVAKSFECGKSIDRLRKGYRSIRVKSHIIFYKKSPNNTVEIIRMLHHRMNVESHL